jgi:hypothetical protein
LTSMTAPNLSTDVNDAFFQPLSGLVESAPALRNCPDVSDDAWVMLGLHRVLESSGSGRGFLQEHGPRFEQTPKVANYFATLRSTRRLEVLRHVNGGVLQRGDFGDQLAGVDELERYECFAVDGHWHQAATHDLRHDGTKMAVGHLYSLNLRGHQMEHLTAAEGLHEHDMSMLKRVKPKGLRHRVPPGRRVLIVYDKAGIDFDYWKRCRVDCAVYFLSRRKAGMIFAWEGDREVDRRDRGNAGIMADTWVRTRTEQRLRLIHYQDPISGRIFEFLTNEPDLPPGVLAELYRRRWQLEKVFDEIKNKLNERKAWATSLTAKAIQANFVALAHNLLLLYERRLEKVHGLSNDGEDRRRDKRLATMQTQARSFGRVLPTLLLNACNASQRSVKFIRWLRHAIRDKLTEEAATPRLRQLYATL